MYLYAAPSSSPKKAGRSRTSSSPAGQPRRHTKVVTSPATQARPVLPKVKFLSRSNNASPEKKTKVYGSPKLDAKANSLAKAKSSLEKNPEEGSIIDLAVGPKYKKIRPDAFSSAQENSKLAHRPRKTTASDTVTSTQAKPIFAPQVVAPTGASISECSLTAKALIRNYMLDEGFYQDVSSEDNWEYVPSLPDRSGCFQTTTVPSEDSENTVLVGIFPSEAKAIEIYVPSVKHHLPTVKVIAEKYCKFKNGGIEIRQLEEKIICIEYDIDESARRGRTNWEPRRLRTYFSLKPKHKDPNEEHAEIKQNENVPAQEPNDIMTMIMNNIKLDDSDLRTNKLKEIEIIDVNYENNREYLQDLKNVLDKKYVRRHKTQKHIINLEHLNEGALSNDDSPSLLTPVKDLESRQKLGALKELITNRSRLNTGGSNKLKIRIPTTECLDELKKTPAVVSTSLLKKVWHECKNLELSNGNDLQNRNPFTSSSTIVYMSP